MSALKDTFPQIKFEDNAFTKSRRMHQFGNNQ